MRAAAAADNPDDAYWQIAQLLRAGKIIPVLGAGANLCGRPRNAGYQLGRYLPSGRELAARLAERVEYPNDEALYDSKGVVQYDLAQVAQYLAALRGEGSLDDELVEVFDANYPPTLLHRFLAQRARDTRQAAAARQEKEPGVRQGPDAGCMLIATVNYDDLLERAFKREKEPYDLITYINDVDADRGLFRHTSSDGTSSVIREPNNSNLLLDQRTVIAKIHGEVDRINRAANSVITEDDYVDYITRADIANLFPVHLAAKMMRSHFLFFGYSLRDWNFRVMLYRLRQKQMRKKRISWAIEANPRRVDSVTWNERGVEILPVSIEGFIAKMRGYFP